MSLWRRTVSQGCVLCTTEDRGGVRPLSSQQIRHIHGHLINLCSIELFDIAQDSNVVCFDEVDGHSFTTETTGTTDTMDVQLARILTQQQRTKQTREKNE